MSMPTLPPQPHRPCLFHTKIDLLESIALEEIALAHILNAEAEKVQAFVGECFDFPTHPTNKEILAINKSVNQLIETVLMKEWLLLRKLENVLEIECDCCKKDHKKDDKKDHHMDTICSPFKPLGSL
ncbi:hypothetical protein [Neobacillus niacini]|uniref:hypothetical protein n=1 Tax=Neobacillus niacini TaxID=86668 RepID=UPI00203A4259|nr:hypothetical protein [Neobacillus niacini]